MKKLSLGDPTRFAEVKWLLCGFVWELLAWAYAKNPFLFYLILVTMPSIPKGYTA
jgi:hypothetical protein